MATLLGKHNCSGLREATPHILARLNESVPCKLARIFLRVEDSPEVWVLDSAAAAADPDALPVRRPLSGDVKAAFKNRRTTVVQIGGTPSKSRATSSKAGGRAAGKKKASLVAEPLLSTFVPSGEADDDFAGAGFAPDEPKHVLTAPAQDVSGHVVAVVQLVNKLDGFPFTQQDEYLLRGAAQEVVVMIETTQLATDAATAATQLDALTALIGQLGTTMKDLPGQDGFDSWLEAEIAKVVPCDSATAFWLDPENSSHLQSADGTVVPVGDADTMPPPPTPAVSSPSSGDSHRHVMVAFVDRRTVVVGGPASHLTVPILSQASNDSTPLGVLHLHGGEQRKAATGGTTFSGSDRRFAEDLAAHVGIYSDMQAASGPMSNRTLSISKSIKLAQPPS